MLMSLPYPWVKSGGRVGHHWISGRGMEDDHGHHQISSLRVKDVQVITVHLDEKGRTNGSSLDIWERNGGRHQIS